MARSRNIKPGVMENEDLAELAPIARLLFIYLWMLADRDGRLEDRPKKIKAKALAYDVSADADALLNDLREGGFIVRYEVQSVKYIQITNFSKHQKPHSNETKSEIPPCPQELLTMVESPCTQGDEDCEEGKEALVPCISDSLIDRLTDSPIPDCPIAEEPPLSISSPAAPKNDRDEISEIFAYWQKRMDSPKSKLDDKRRKTIKKALEMKYSPADLCRAIRGCSLTPHNMGENDRAEKFNGIDLIFRNADQIDRFIANSSSPPRATAAGSAAQRRDAESEANLRAFLGEDQPQDPMTIEME